VGRAPGRAAGGNEIVGQPFQADFAAICVRLESLTYLKENHRMKTSFWRRWWSSACADRPGRPIVRGAPQRRPLLVEQLEDRRLLSGTPQLLADINPGAAFSNPSQMVVIGSTTYFAANDGTHGNELWKTDGTPAGTMRVADINPGSGSSNPTDLTNFNGKLYFAANDGVQGTELWTSDGTPGGTTRVADINPGSAGSYPRQLTVMNGKLYFTASDGTDGTELWTSDGTTPGTIMLKDINPGSSLTYYYSGAYGSYSRTVVTEGSYPSNLTNVNGRLYFTANDGTDGTELWTSDGTTTGTTLFKDINPGSSTSTFVIRWGYFGNEYRTVTVPNGSYPSNLTNVNGTLYFTASDGQGTELWTGDGIPADTVSLTGAVNPGNLTNLNGTLYFIAQGNQLWSSNGTTSSTVKVTSLAGANDLTNVNGELYFAGNDGTHGTELWRSNGTAAGTTMVKDINPGSSLTYYYSGAYGSYSRTVVTEGSYPSNLTNVNGRLYFTANDGTDGTELWTSDGTTTGTTLVQDINPGSTSYTSYSTGGYGGTETRTWTLPNSSFPGSLTNFNGTLLFAANDGTNGNELWTVPSGPSLALSAGTNTPTAGNGDTITITALNADGTLDTGLNGAVNLTCSDPNAIFPTSVILTNGTGQFSATLKTAGAQWIRATVAQTPSDSGSDANIVVQPGTAVSFTLSGFPSPETAGVAGSFTVTAYDGYGNVATTYAGTVQFTSNDPQASLPGAATLTNGTGQFSATLKTLGTNLSIKATDKNNSSLTATQSGIEVIPFASITGPSAGAINQTLTYTLGAGPDPAGTVFTVSWGDGSSTQTTGTTVSHTYSASAIYSVSVTASAAGLSSKAATESVNIQPVSVTIEADPARSGAEMLVIASTANFERLALSGNSGGVSLTFDGIALGTILPTNGETFALVEAFAGGTSDLLDARNLSVSCVLVGGPGNDTLYGGSGRNLLIGGAGSDTLYAGSAGDILIGGTTSYDTNNSSDQTALAYIMAEWNSTASYSTRIKQLTGKAGSGGLNGKYFLNSATVSDDNTSDVLEGGAGLDWYFAHRKGKTPDKVVGQTSGETITNI
jgi:ELWxxDGT repeat protein